MYTLVDSIDRRCGKPDQNPSSKPTAFDRPIFTMSTQSDAVPRYRGLKFSEDCLSVSMSVGNEFFTIAANNSNEDETSVWIVNDITEAVISHAEAAKGESDALSFEYTPSQKPPQAAYRGKRTVELKSGLKDMKASRLMSTVTTFS